MKLALALAAMLGAPAGAATLPALEFDLARSSVAVSLSSGCERYSCGTLSGSFGSGAAGFSWSPAATGESIHVADFFRWEQAGFGQEGYVVDVALAFGLSGAGPANLSGSGQFSTVAFDFLAGAMTWQGPARVALDQGAVLAIVLDDISGFGGPVADYNDPTTYSFASGATFTLSGPEPAPVPLPAGGLLLAAALLLLPWVARRRRA